jgi:hypothetical protein
METQRLGSCDVAMSKPINLENVMKRYDPEKQKNVILVDTGGKPVSQEKIAAIQVYAKLLRKKFPHMKPERLKRKVAEYFKIKLV